MPAIPARRAPPAEQCRVHLHDSGFDRHPIEPAREFPVDGAAGEGFTNTGQSLVMSPALVEKYLAAGRDVASHLVLLPEGIRFSEGTTRRDWTNEIVSEIRSIYLQNTSANLDMSAQSVERRQPLSVTEEDGRVDLTPLLRGIDRPSR